MGYRFIPPITLLSQAVSGTGVVTSGKIDVRTLPFAWVTIGWTGTLKGTFSIQGSLDGVNFDDMGITVAPAAGSAGRRAIDLTTGASFIQVVYTPDGTTPGSGTMTVMASAKSGG